MQSKTFNLASIIIWVLAMSSLAGTYLLINKKTPREDKSFLEMKAAFEYLPEDEKNSIKYFESGIIKSKDNKIHLIGASNINEEAVLKLSMKKIDVPIQDSLIIVRRFVANEAFNRLNNAERNMVVKNKAAILFRDGNYVLFYDRDIYAEFVKKYGTECKKCDEKKKSTK